MNKLWVRLSLGFSLMVLVAVFVVALTGILAGRSDRIRHPSKRADITASLVSDLAGHYRTRQSWSGSDRLLLRATTNAIFNRQIDRDWAYFLTDVDGHIVANLDPTQIGRKVPPQARRQLVPIQVDQQTVGYIGVAPIFVRPAPGPPDFFQFLGRTLVVAAVVAGLGGILFGVVMSRSLTAPLSRLAEAAKAIGARNLSRRVEEKGSDEMIAVARAFNEMAADLEQAEQLRRNLLADVAHELRTPLSVLQGNLRAILDEVYPLEQAEIARLYEHSRFLGRLVNDLHLLAQAEARQLPLDLAETDLAQIIAGVVDSFRPNAETQGVILQCELPAALPSLHLDRARMAQVLHNLLANALRHTPAGGTITVRAEKADEAILLAVSDTGEGIPPEHLPHVFDRFYRTDAGRSRDRGGAGLGLAISRAVVEAHGGQISVASAGPGAGTTFSIRLPLGSPSL